MGEEKVRISGEISRPADSAILPTVNPDIEKAAQLKKADNGIPPAVYVMFVSIIIALPVQSLIDLPGCGFLYLPVLSFLTSGSYLPLDSVRCTDAKRYNRLLTISQVIPFCSRHGILPSQR
jgi:hypothetical protein